MLTHTISSSWQGSNGTGSISESYALQANAENNVDESIPGTTTNENVNWQMKIASLVSLFMVSDVALTVQTNSGSNTFALQAGVPLMWNAQTDGALRDTSDVLVTVDITKLLVTNPGATAANFKIRALYNS